MCSRALDNNCEISQNISHYVWKNTTKYSRRHKKVPVPYSYYDSKTLRSVKRYDPITVQIVITVVYLLRNRADFTGK